MSNYIENMLLLKVKDTYGWRRTIVSTDNLEKPVMNRSIRIGSAKNCNDDGIIKDYSIENKLLDFVNKFNIQKYEIINHNNKDEFSYELKVDNETYTSFTNNLQE
jgi:hypothetical protein